MVFLANGGIPFLQPGAEIKPTVTVDVVARKSHQLIDTSDRYSFDYVSLGILPAAASTGPDVSVPISS